MRSGIVLGLAETISIMSITLRGGGGGGEGGKFGNVFDDPIDFNRNDPINGKVLVIKCFENTLADEENMRKRLVVEGLHEGGGEATP